MKTILLRPTAEADIDAIWDYTAQTWGRNQANKYVSDIQRGLSALAQGQRVSTPIDHIRDGYSRLIINKHAIFLQELDDTLDVVRILHQRMDVQL